MGYVVFILKGESSGPRDRRSWCIDRFDRVESFRVAVIGGAHQTGRSLSFLIKRAVDLNQQFRSLAQDPTALYIYITGIECLVPHCQSQRFLPGLRPVLPLAPNETACHTDPSTSSFDQAECPQTRPALALPSGNSFRFPLHRPSDP